MTTLQTRQSLDEEALAADLAALGYPGLPHLAAPHSQKNPAELLLTALSAAELDSRLIEALPWVVWKFPVLDWEWLIIAARNNALQNRLGFITNIARRLAQQRGEHEKAALLAQVEAELEGVRLLQEDTLCHDSLTRAEQRWLQTQRSPEAKHWRLLTDLMPEHLDHAA